jgi:hypothetical protein
MNSGSRSDAPGTRETRRAADKERNPSRSLRVGRLPDMDEPPDLEHNGHWRMAVWALRVGYLGLAVAIAGLIALAFGSTPWILASGVIIWLATVPVTLTGFLWARKELPEPRLRLWSMRLMLIHDSTHPLSSAQ